MVGSDSGAMLHLVRRDVAKRIGLKRYFTGAPCPNGHLAERFVSGGQCTSCGASRAKSWRSDNRQQVAERRRRYLDENRGEISSRRREAREADIETYRARGRETYHRHAEKRKAYNAAWRLANGQRIKASMRAWREANRDEIRAYNRRNNGKLNANCKARRARLLRALPGWLTPADFAAISAIYVEAARVTKETGVLHHVDHEIPLKGRLVCGLHVPSNLRVITAVENHSKNNRYQP